MPHIPTETADRWYEELQGLDYRRHEITVAGRKVFETRLRCYFGSEGSKFVYSGTTNVGTGLPPLIEEIKSTVEALLTEAGAPATFNSVLVNYYRDVEDRIGWHADKLQSLVPGQPIASLSLGATRKFQIKSSGEHAPADLPIAQGYRSTVSKTGVLTLMLDHGAVITMNAGFQAAFKHQVPKQALSRQTYYKGQPHRFNLTFRCVDEA